MSFVKIEGVKGMVFVPDSHLQEKITARIVFPVSFVRMNDAKSASKDATAKHHSRAQINAMKADIS